MENTQKDSSDLFLEDLSSGNNKQRINFNDQLFNKGRKFTVILFLRRLLSFVIDKIIIISIFIITLIIVLGKYNWQMRLGAATNGLTIEYEFALFCKDTQFHNLYKAFVDSMWFLSVMLLLGRIYYYVCEIIFNRSIGKIIFKLIYIKEDKVPSKLDFAKKNLYYLIFYICVFALYINVELLWQIPPFYMIIFTNIIMFGVMLIYKVTLYELFPEIIVTLKNRKKNDVDILQ